MQLETFHSALFHQDGAGAGAEPVVKVVVITDVNGSDLGTRKFVVLCLCQLFGTGTILFFG